MNSSLDLIAIQLLRAVRFALEGDGLNLCSHIERVAVLIRNSSIRMETDSSHHPLPAWRCNRLFCYIETNLSQNIRTSQLGALVGLSHGHLSRTFKRHFGLNLRIYINCRRIAMAQNLMLSTGDTLAEIALKCGMYDQAHFSRTFRKLAGESPSRWREKYRSIALQRDSTTDSTAALLQRFDQLQGTVHWKALRGALNRAEMSRAPSDTAR
jgi:AraC-like DNA-binding protein